MTDNKAPLGVANTANPNAADTTKKEEPKVTMSQYEANQAKEKEEELEAEYIDKRSVVIAAITNYSAYRKMNIAALEAPTLIIGSSVNSCRKLMANKDEIAAYYPELTGIASNHPDFITRVKSYLNNIRVIVDPTKGKVLNTTFVFKHKRDYLAFKKEEDRILNAYDKFDRNNPSELYKAANRRDDELNRLYSTLHEYGYPENITDFIIYRHCILYSEVAKDTSFINNNPNVRFYIKDVAKEKDKETKRIAERKTAMTNVINLFASPTKTIAVAVSIATYKNSNITLLLEKDNSEIEKYIMDFATENPSKFNKMFTDKNLEVKAFIETLISRGELIRAELNQQISTPDGQFIGANVNEAIAFFANPENAPLKSRLEAKLKIINT